MLTAFLAFKQSLEKANVSKNLTVNLPARRTTQSSIRFPLPPWTLSDIAFRRDTNKQKCIYRSQDTVDASYCHRVRVRRLLAGGNSTQKLLDTKWKSCRSNPETFRPLRDWSLLFNDYTQIPKSHLTLSNRISSIEETVTVIHYFPMGWPEMSRGFRGQVVTSNNSKKRLRIERAKSHYQKSRRAPSRRSIREQTNEPVYLDHAEGRRV